MKTENKKTYVFTPTEFKKLLNIPEDENIDVSIIPQTDGNIGINVVTPTVIYSNFSEPEAHGDWSDPDYEVDEDYRSHFDSEHDDRLNM